MGRSKNEITTSIQCWEPGALQRLQTTERLALEAARLWMEHVTLWVWSQVWERWTPAPARGGTVPSQRVGGWWRGEGVFL
jgi:hypothetical protein